MEVCSYSYFWCCEYFQGPWCHLLQQMSSQWGSQNVLQGLVSHELTPYFSVFNLFLTQLWPYYQKDVTQTALNHTTLTLNFTNIQGLYSNFVECQSFFDSDSPDILALRETNLDDSSGSGNFAVKVYLPLILKDCVTHIQGLAVYVKEGLLFGWDLSLENCVGSYLCYPLALLHSVPYYFFLHQSPSSLWSVFMLTDEVLSINPSANFFLLGDLNSHLKDWLTFSGTDKTGELIIFPSQMTLLRWLTFLLRSMAVAPIVLLFWISFFLLTLVFVL